MVRGRGTPNFLNTDALLVWQELGRTATRFPASKDLALVLSLWETFGAKLIIAHFREATIGLLLWSDDKTSSLIVVLDQPELQYLLSIAFFVFSYPI